MSYNAEIQNNNKELRDILEVVNDLPAAETDTVKYVPQTLTAEQKAQARANIGAAEDSILEMVDSIEDCIDTSKRYVLPDGYVYAWTYGEHIVESKNHILSSINSDGTPYNGGQGYKEGYRLNSSGVETSSSIDAIVSGFIPYNGEDIELRIPNTSPQSDHNYFHLYNSEFSIVKATADGTIIDGSYRILKYWVDNYGATATIESATSTTKYILPKELIHEDAAYIRVSSYASTAVNSNTFDLALDEGLDDREVIADYSWQNTGLYYGSPDTGKRLDELETAVDDHEERLTILEAGNTGNNDTPADVPDYWKEHLSEKADAIQTAMEKAGRNKSAFLWYTDAHWVNGNSKVSPKLLNYLYMNTPMNKVNFGGDIIGDTLLATREEMKYLYEWRKAIKDLPNHHSVFGNHDMFDLSSVDYEDDNYRYAFLLAPEETHDIVWGDGNYYYIDNPAEKTRYFYIAYMTSDLTAMMAQGQFFCDALRSAPEGWHIVAIAHRWWQYNSSSTPTTGSIPGFEADMLSVFDAYNARSTRSGSNYFVAQDFTDAKGRVEFCIGGHIHVDFDFCSDGGIPVIITTADANQNRVPDSIVDSGTVGTTTEAAVFGIIADYNDSENTKITVVGVGRGTSRVISKNKIPVSISEVGYGGDALPGAVIDKSQIHFTVHYNNGDSSIITGATSVSPEIFSGGNNGNCAVTVGYTENGVTVYLETTIKVTEAPEDIELTSISDIYYNGNCVIGTAIDKSKFVFTAYYSDGSSHTVNGATSVSPETIEAVGDNTVTITYTDGTTVSGTTIIVGEPVPATILFNLDRTYVAGTAGETLGLSHLDESKAYTNVAYGNKTFNASSCTTSDITENSVTVKESGSGGVTVAYPIHLTDIVTQDYKITFDYSGTGKCRTYWCLVKSDGTVTSSKTVYQNDTSGASGSADVVLKAADIGVSADVSCEWLIIMLSSNTSGTKTFSNVSLTKA